MTLSEGERSLSVSLDAFQTSGPATQRARPAGIWLGIQRRRGWVRGVWWRGNGQLRLNVRVIGLNVVFILPPPTCGNTRGVPSYQAKHREAFFTVERRRHVRHDARPTLQTWTGPNKTSPIRSPDGTVSWRKGFG